MARIKYYDEATGQWIYADQAITAGGGSSPPYKLPVAAAGTLGGIQADTQLDEDTQPVRIGTDNKLYTKPGQVPEPYKLPTASESELGGVKVSAPDPKTNDWFRVFIDGAGKLHTLTHAAEADTFGCIKADEAPLTATEPIYIGKDGKLRYIPQEIPVPPDPPAPYELPVATADTLGGIKADAKSDADTQPVTIGPDNKLYTKPGGGGGTGGTVKLVKLKGLDITSSALIKFSETFPAGTLYTLFFSFDNVFNASTTVLLTNPSGFTTTVIPVHLKNGALSSLEFSYAGDGVQLTPKSDLGNISIVTLQIYAMQI